LHPQRDDLSAEQRKVLEVLARTFSTYITEDPAAADLKERLNESEAALATARNKMKLGYTDPQTGARGLMLILSYDGCVGTGVVLCRCCKMIRSRCVWTLSN
jgi:hypothetical protein